LHHIPRDHNSPFHDDAFHCKPLPQDPSPYLHDLSNTIKATLTSLLNCESVKHNAELRSWVQERLMEAEHDLKRQKRRRSSLEGERWV